MEGKREEKEESSLPPPIISGSRLAYDDMEEGEIVEDDGFNSSNEVKRRADSDVESGEIRAGEARADSDVDNMVRSVSCYAICCEFEF